MSKSSEYWEERFRQLEEAQHDTSVQKMYEIEQQFRRSQSVLEGQINAWYQRFADNNGISMTEARKLLNGNELEELKWSVQEYIEKGRTLNYSPEWSRALENASARVHINRLEAIKLQTQMEMEKLFGNCSDIIDGHIKDIYTSGYYHTAFEIQKRMGVGWNMSRLNEEKLRSIIYQPWAVDGRNFSERIWTSKTQLINQLHDSLTRMCITGEAPDKAIAELAKKMGVSKSQAGNIILTESAAFSAKAQEKCYTDLGIKEFQVVETLDSITCGICAGMDGQHFPMSDYKIGVTVPPFHPRCRCCTCPYYDDEFTTGKRIARGADGKQYEVLENMTYREWERVFVNGGICWTGEEKSDKIHFMDITKDWIMTNTIKGSVIEKQEYVINGATYRVDGKHVILRPTEQEWAVATALSDKYGKTVELVPQVMFPQGIQTPDYLIDGKRFDLKSPIGRGKNLLYGMIAKKQKQSHNFIVDVTSCPLSMDELERQAEELYKSPRVGFLEQIVFMKDDEVVKVLDRGPRN